MKLVKSGLLSLKFCDIENFAIFSITLSKLVEFTLEFFFKLQKVPTFFIKKKQRLSKKKKPKKCLVYTFSRRGDSTHVYSIINLGFVLFSIASDHHLLFSFSYVPILWSSIVHHYVNL
jgi:hypothetical protein